MNSPMRHARAWETDPEVLICLVTVPVLSRSAEAAYPAPPTIGVYAATRPDFSSRGTDAHDGSSMRSAARAEASLDQAVANARRATRVASLSARQAKRGLVTFGQAEADAVAAERARAEAGELAIVSALAQDKLLSARIATLERQRARAETRASVASLLMAGDAQVGTGTPTQTPMFTLIHDGATPKQAAVFEEDLVRLVAGQDVTLSLKDPSAPVTAACHGEEIVVDLRAQLARAGAVHEPSQLVQGMFLSVDLLASSYVAASTLVSTASSGPWGCDRHRVSLAPPAFLAGTGALRVAAPPHP